MHRIGAIVIGLALCGFGAAGLAGVGSVFPGSGLGGGMGAGLLATIVVVFGVGLIAAAAVDGPTASTALVVLGAVFVIAGLLGLFALDRYLVGSLRVALAHVVFCLVAGSLCVSVGMYGRLTGQLPADNPYRLRGGGRNRLSQLWHDEDLTQTTPPGPEAAARRLRRTEELAEAEYAVAEGTATPEQTDQVMEDSARRAEERRNAAWRSFTQGSGAD